MGNFVLVVPSLTLFVLSDVLLIDKKEKAVEIFPLFWKITY